MTKFTLDGVEFNTEAEVVSALTSLKTQLDSANMDADHYRESLEQMTAARDSAMEQVEQLKRQVQDAAAAAPAAIESAVKARIALRDAAVAAGITLTGDESDLDIRKAVILAASPKAELADKSESYIEARFDAACELLADKDAQGQANRRQVAENPSHTDGAPVSDADKARQRYLDSLTTGWKQSGNK